MSRESLERVLAGAVGHVPAALLRDARVTAQGVRLYALIRCFPGGDTWRAKPELAEVLGWSETTVHRAAKCLARAGWLTQSRRRDAGVWVSTWKATTIRSDSGEAPTTFRSDSPPLSDLTVRHYQICKKSTPPSPLHPPALEAPPPGGEGRGFQISSEEDLWAALPYSVRRGALEGSRELLAACAELVGRDDSRLGGVSRASLVCAAWERIESRDRLAGLRALPAVLMARARERDAVADEAAVAERVASLERQRALRAKREAREQDEASRVAEATPDKAVLDRLTKAANAKDTHARSKRR